MAALAGRTRRSAARPLCEGRSRGFVLDEPTGLRSGDRVALRIITSRLAGGVERPQLSQQPEAHLDSGQRVRSESLLSQLNPSAGVGRLAADVAHELNTPLNAILLGIEMARQNLHQNPERAEKRLQLAVGAAAKASAIITRLLNYSRGMP